MIAIVNVGPAKGNRQRRKAIDPLGEHNYELRINALVVAQFTHRRGDTLATCLTLAAKASELAKANALTEQTRLLNELASKF